MHAEVLRMRMADRERQWSYDLGEHKGDFWSGVLQATLWPLIMQQLNTNSEVLANPSRVFGIFKNLRPMKICDWKYHSWKFGMHDLKTPFIFPAVNSFCKTERLKSEVVRFDNRALFCKHLFKDWFYSTVSFDGASTYIAIPISGSGFPCHPFTFLFCSCS